MADMKIVFGLKDGTSVQTEFSSEDAKALQGKRIGDKVKGETLGLTGYEFEITGGSDSAGFPMRHDVEGTGLKQILTTSGIGVSNKKPHRDKHKKGLRTMAGMRTRKTVAGNTVGDRIVQLNLKVLKEGKQPLGEQPEEGGEAPAEGEAPAQEAPKKEQPSEEAPKKEKKEEPVEEKEEAPKEEQPTEEASEEKKE